MTNNNGRLTATATTARSDEEPMEAQKTTNEDNNGGRK